MTEARNANPEVRISDRVLRPMHWRKFATYVALFGPEDDSAPTEFGGEPPEVTFDLPPSVLPRLLDLDLEDVESILSFIETFGFLDAPALALSSGDFDPPPDIGSIPVWRNKRWPGDEGEFGVETLDAFRIGAASLQAAELLARELAANSFSARRVSKAWPKYEPWGVFANVSKMNPSKARPAAELWLTRFLNVGLSLQALRASASFQPGVGYLSVAVRPRESLFGLLTLELIDSIENNLPYRRCAWCGNTFNKQDGRSQKNAFARSDSLYCTSRCARSKAQSDYYKRKKAKREG